MNTFVPPAGLRLREAHAHLAWHGRSLGMLRLGDCTSVAECLDRVAAEVRRMAASGSRDWLMGVQLRIEGWAEPRWPTRQELDAVTGGGVGGGGRPAWLMSFDHHSLVANSAALAAAGFTDASPDPEGGVLGRDAAGRLTGLCLEAACRRVREVAPEPPLPELRRHVQAALRDLAAMGFVEVHDLLTQPWLPSMLADLHDAGELPVRVGLFPLVEHLPAVAASKHTWQRPGLELLGGKVFVDGTLNARTAWMHGPYGDPAHPFGTPLMSTQTIANAIRRCSFYGVGFAAHAIGDAAVHACLGAMRVLRRESGSIAPDARIRIEHAEIIQERDIPDFAKLGVVASVQPCHLLYDMEVLERFLAFTLSRVLPLRDLIQSGLVPGETLIFGSDTPIVRPNPEDSIQAAVHRRRAGMPSGGAISPGQALTEQEAWACFARP